jgi:hypothetical protein
MSQKASELEWFFGRRWVYNIKMDVSEIEWSGIDWIVAQIETNGGLFWAR